MEQSTLSGGPVSNESMYVYLRRVREGSIREKVIPLEESGKLLSVIESLLRSGASCNLDELHMSQNPREWVTRILKELPNHDRSIAKYLLTDFCDRAQTRMREEDKHAILVVWKDTVLLCHSSAGERTITPSLDVIERMVDTDNVERFVKFEKKKEEINVRYYEKTKSKSLAQWLGISESEIPYWLGGEIRIYCKIDEEPCVFEFSREEFDDKFIQSAKLKFEDSLLRVSEGTILPVTQIMIGKRLYKTTEKFMQEYMSLFYDLDYYHEKYRELKSSLLPHTTTIIDEETCVKCLRKGSWEKPIVKQNPNFQILFVDDDIKIDPSWISEISSSFLGRTPVKLYHAGMRLSARPLVIGPFEIYNNIDGVNEDILVYLSKLHESAKDAKSLKITQILCYSIFHALSKLSNAYPIQYLFNELAKTTLGLLRSDTSLVLQMETGILEYKDRDWLVDNDGTNIRKITDALSATNAKVIIVGISEDLQQMSPLTCNKFRSERLETIVRGLKEKLPNCFADVFRLPLKNEECLLVIVSIPLRV